MTDWRELFTIAAFPPKVPRTFSPRNYFSRN
uniref:Uncharacterized protein n=1 Tax=Anguilla anguilla TaxID=7936 RepID=A0A0E9XK18_ANGAN